VIGWRVWLAGVIWLVLLGLWTYGLLSPSAHEDLGPYVPEGLHFSAAKALHVSAYAFLTFTAAWLPTPGRWSAWVGLVLHAGLTEWLQTLVGRGGSVWDVLIDCAGIAIGLLAVFCVGRIWPPKQEAEPTTQR